MSFWIPAAVSGATSMLGHVLRNRGGRPPEPDNISTQGLENRMGEIRESGQAEFDSMLSVGAAQSGFQGMANNRMGATWGAPGMFTARNQSMGAEARGQAFEGFVRGRQGRDQMLNQLQTQITGIDAQNTQNKWQSDMNRWQTRRNDQNTMLTGLGGAAMQYGSDRFASQQHQDQQGLQTQQMGLLQQYIEQQNPFSQGPAAGPAPYTGQTGWQGPRQPWQKKTQAFAGTSG